MKIILVWWAGLAGGGLCAGVARVVTGEAELVPLPIIEIAILALADPVRAARLAVPEIDG